MDIFTKIALANTEGVQTLGKTVFNHSGMMGSYGHGGFFMGGLFMISVWVLVILVIFALLKYLTESKGKK
jgi:uncharacterized membrane protein